ncbi:MAG TPA: protein kinase [Candidatus Xenobia bacterium]|jgi:serine/threonine-protein kinase
MNFDELRHSVINGRYRLTEVLGAAGGSAVFAADTLERFKVVGRCAVRILQPSDDVTSPPFLPDVSAMLQSVHPSLMRTTQTGDIRTGPAAGCMFLVEELAERPASAGDILPMTREVVATLRYLHEHDSLHGRVKPNNILQVADTWKLAHPAQVPSAHLLAHAIAGQGLAYVAPEVLIGPSLPAADVWGLGATLLALLTGRPPFEAASVEDLARVLLTDSPRVPEDLPPPFDLIVPGCLQRDLERRWSLPRVAAVLSDTLYVPEPCPPPRPRLSAPDTGAARSLSIPARVRCLQWSGDVLLAGLNDGTVLAWRDAELVWKTSLSGPVVGLAHHDPWLSAALRNGTVHRLDLATGQPLQAFDTGHEVFDVATDGRRLYVSLGQAGLGALHPDDGRLELVSPHPSWRLAAGAPRLSGAVDGRVWRDHPHPIAVHPGPVSAVACQGERSISASWAGTLFSSPGEPLQPGGAPILCLDATPHAVAAGSADGTVRWYFRSGAARVLPLSTAPLTALAVSNHTMAAATSQGKLQLWPLPQEAPR